MKKIVTVQAGSTFGDLALQGAKKGLQRQATIMTNEDCKFLILDRNSYDVTGY